MEVKQIYRCISFDSYIKPQPLGKLLATNIVVYLLIPTSNHNSENGDKRHRPLYIF